MGLGGQFFGPDRGHLFRFLDGVWNKVLALRRLKIIEKICLQKYLIVQGEVPTSVACPWEVGGAEGTYAENCESMMFLLEGIKGNWVHFEQTPPTHVWNPFFLTLCLLSSAAISWHNFLLSHSAISSWCALSYTLWKSRSSHWASESESVDSGETGSGAGKGGWAATSVVEGDGVLTTWSSIRNWVELKGALRRGPLVGRRYTWKRFRGN